MIKMEELISYIQVIRLKIEVQLNLFLATIHSVDMEIAIDRWMLIAE